MTSPCAIPRTAPLSLSFSLRAPLFPVNGPRLDERRCRAVPRACRVGTRARVGAARDIRLCVSLIAPVMILTGNVESYALVRCRTGCLSLRGRISAEREDLIDRGM